MAGTGSSSTALESVIGAHRTASVQKPLLRLDAGALLADGKESFDAADLAALWGRTSPSSFRDPLCVVSNASLN